MAKHPSFKKRVINFYTHEEQVYTPSNLPEGEANELVVYDPNVLTTKRKVRWGRITKHAGVLFLTASLVTGVLIARDRNVNMGLEGPTQEDLAALDNLGKDTAPKKEGSEGQEFGKEEAENNYNNITSQNPANQDTNVVNGLVNGTLTFNFTSNGAPVQNVYSFDTQNGTYTVNQTVSITLASGRVVNTTSSKSGRYALETGTLRLFENSGLNAGDVILGNDPQVSDQYADIIYIDNAGRIIGTISGVMLEGASSVYSAPTQTSTEPTNPDLENGPQTTV